MQLLNFYLQNVSSFKLIIVYLYCTIKKNNMNLEKISKTTELTMTSRELAELTGKRHADVMRGIRSLLNKGVGESLFSLGEYFDATSRKLPMFQLSKAGLKLYIDHSHKTPALAPLVEIYNAMSGDGSEVLVLSSRWEISFVDMLEEALETIGIFGKRQYSAGGYKIDYYIEDLNLAIEYDETQHFNPSYKEKDYQRQKLLESKLGCKFIRVDSRQSDIRNVTLILKEILQDESRKTN